jgi:hypothetical protein
LLPQVLDLTGSRDFLDAETARQVLGPLLAAGAAHKHVSGTGLQDSSKGTLAGTQTSACGEQCQMKVVADS